MHSRGLHCVEELHYPSPFSQDPTSKMAAAFAISQFGFSYLLQSTTSYCNSTGTTLYIHSTTYSIIIYISQRCHSTAPKDTRMLCLVLSYPVSSCLNYLLVLMQFNTNHRISHFYHQSQQDIPPPSLQLLREQDPVQLTADSTTDATVNTITDAPPTVSQSPAIVPNSTLLRITRHQMRLDVLPASWQPASIKLFYSSTKKDCGKFLLLEEKGCKRNCFTIKCRSAVYYCRSLPHSYTTTAGLTHPFPSSLVSVQIPNWI